MGLQTKFAQLVACILCNFLLPLTQKNSAAVNSVRKFRKNLMLYFQLFWFLRFLLFNEQCFYLPVDYDGCDNKNLMSAYGTGTHPYLSMQNKKAKQT